MQNPRNRSALSLSSLGLAAAILAGCQSDEPKADEEGTYGDAAETAAYCESDWFPHSQTPAPAEGEGSPFDVSSTTNLIFHQWSWQKFLWLTKPQENGLPLFLNETVQVTDHMELVSVPSGVSVALTDTEQAGSDAVLTTNPAYNADGLSATVYYSIHVSDVMLLAAEAFRVLLADGLLPADNLEVFPVGSLELKVSWVDVAAIPEAQRSDYFTTSAMIGDDLLTTVAMLGMHVVGVVENHPEFIWATFEHEDLGPSFDWASQTASSSADELLFQAGTTTGLDGITWTGTSAKAPYEAFDLFEVGVPRVPGNGFMTTSQSEPENFDNIQAINACVAQSLDDVWANYFYNGSTWINTDGMTPAEQAQLIVNLGNGIGSAVPGASARGSLNNANLTMETFTQTFQGSLAAIDVSSLVNCLTCHTASHSGNSSPLYISHIFDSSVQAAQGSTRAEIDAEKARFHKRLMQSKR